MLLHVAICEDCKKLLQDHSETLFDLYRDVCIIYCSQQSPVKILNDNPEMELIEILDEKRYLVTLDTLSCVLAKPHGYTQKSRCYHVICPNLCK